MTDLTLTEAVNALKRAEPKLPITPRSVRYAMARQSRLRPTHEPAGRGDAALYSVYDLATLRLFFKVEEVYGYKVAWAALTYLGPEIRDAYKDLRFFDFLVIENSRARLVPRDEALRLAAERPHLGYFELDIAWLGTATAVLAEIEDREKEGRRVPRWAVS